jgi:pyruvate dehydrogenase E2 component (dihydrolipoamide acetyltransferase)
MIIEVTMPVLGLTMEAGTIVAWLKEVGDKVEAGEPLFLVETDKATSDAPAPATGILARIVAQEGETVAVGEAIALIAENAADLDSGAVITAEPKDEAVAGAVVAAAASGPAGGEEAAAAAEPAVPAKAAVAAEPAVATPTPAAVPRRVFASPRARTRARELGLDVKAVPHEGERVTDHDVQSVADVKPLTRARRIIAERMALSAATIPQVTYTMRADVTELMDLRRTLKSEATLRGVSLPLDAFFVRAAARALVEFPEVNSEWLEGLGIRTHSEVNVAVAVDVEGRGLMTPVVHDAASLGLWDTAAELDRLIAGVKAGKLGPDDYTGATFTITSLAVSSVERFDPIIVPPQAAILGVGAIVATPVYVRDEVVKRRLLWLCLTTDHRILDGTPSARFLNRIRGLMEEPSGLV